MREKLINYIIIGGLVIALLFLMQRCNEESNKAISATKVLNDKVSYYKNKLGSQTATISVLQTDKRTLKQQVLANDDSLKKLASEFSKLKSIIKHTTLIQIDSIPVPFDVVVPCEFSRLGRYDTKWIDFNYQATNTGLIFQDFNLRNETTIITGFKRKWFLGKQSLKTDITNSNPYFSTNEIKSTTITIPTRFYDTRAFNIGIGIIGGLLIK